MKYMYKYMDGIKSDRIWLSYLLTQGMGRVMRRSSPATVICITSAVDGGLSAPGLTWALWAR